MHSAAVLAPNQTSKLNSSFVLGTCPHPSSLYKLADDPGWNHAVGYREQEVCVRQTSSGPACLLRAANRAEPIVIELINHQRAKQALKGREHVEFCKVYFSLTLRWWIPWGLLCGGIFPEQGLRFELHSFWRNILFWRLFRSSQENSWLEKPSLPLKFKSPGRASVG